MYENLENSPGRKRIAIERKKMVMKHYYGIFLRFRVRILSTALSRDGQNRYHADRAEGSFFHWAARRTHSDLKLRIPIGNSQVCTGLFIGSAGK